MANLWTLPLVAKGIQRTCRMIIWALRLLFLAFCTPSAKAR